ncbi:Aste57867_8915 [Aphanomyces stellatus]|uniref:Aste57867_8915 protein n=1 Tax=Aphanomyces stellatus TaxID=120398 RepID=A0A485KLW6_9STRA|nr:hypothetical protein As57867_008880 [Aphanomyces stellatus]VFT85799.1 Aste57867_8915 [Aphanomyces stellatus]
MQVRNINFGSCEYDAAVQLRDEVLRKPLGLTLNPADLAKEHSDLHVGVFSIANELVAYALLRPTASVAWMKQVAVNPAVQGQGLGRILIHGFEARARAEGFHEIELHARASAVDFYTKLGYVVDGAPFDEVGIPHVGMRKSLVAQE